jgi:TPP-dependent pyruvate/acetoin dehydrogenase alpha subunit
LEKELLTDLYEKMLLTRRFEERVVELFKQGMIPGAVHLGIGHEAFSVGAIAPLRKDDYLLISHRGFGHSIAKGIPPGRILAEYMGKATGCSHGLGCAHLADRTVGMPGVSGCQGGNHVIAPGLALASRMNGTDQVTACVFGDGTANRGTFLEGINLAAVWKLPVVFLCENNRYGFSVPIGKAMVNEDIADRAPSLGLPGVVVDGNDLIAVYEAAEEAVENARSGKGPTLIEGKTYRWRGHTERDPGTAYRDSQEVEEWKQKCPINRMQKRLLEEKIIDPGGLEAIEKGVNRRVEEAVHFAMNSEVPRPDDLEPHVVYYDI